MIQVQFTEDLRQFLAQGARVPRKIEGEAASNLEYILALEYGHSRQAANGMVRRYRREYEQLLALEINEGLRLYLPDVEKAVQAGVAMAVLGITRAIADRTPVDTGRAKGSWVARLPDGSRVQLDRPVTARQQASIRRARIKAQARERARAARQAARQRAKLDRLVAAQRRKVAKQKLRRVGKFRSLARRPRTT